MFTPSMTVQRTLRIKHTLGIRVYSETLSTDKFISGDVRLQRFHAVMHGVGEEKEPTASLHLVCNTIYFHLDAH
jgi:hypothetical protein